MQNSLDEVEFISIFFFNGFKLKMNELMTIIVKVRFHLT